jgi:anti-sigma factor ChrR (cupin superfamily)
MNDSELSSQSSHSQTPHLSASPGSSGEQQSYSQPLAAAHSTESQQLGRVLDFLPASLDLITPPAEAKRTLLARIRTEQAAERQQKPFTARTSGTLPSFSFKREDGSGWNQTFDGVWIKVLAEERDLGYKMMLMRMEPGAHYPEHHHTGVEQCYVLEGQVSVQGEKLFAGDFHRAAAGSDHQEITTETGTKLLLVVPVKDYKTAARMMMPHLAKRFFQSLRRRFKD